MTGCIGLAAEVGDISNEDGGNHAGAKTLYTNSNNQNIQMISNQGLNNIHQTGDTLQPNAHYSGLKNTETVNHDTADEPPKDHERNAKNLCDIGKFNLAKAKIAQEWGTHRI